MDIINVVEFVEPNQVKIDSFYIFNEKTRQNKVEQAENLFVTKARENGMIPSDERYHLENGIFELGNYKLFLVWSE